MISDQDIKKLSEVLATREDLKSLATKEDLKALATKKDLNELAGDVVRIEGRIDDIDSKLDDIALTLKSVPRIKEIIQDKLGVEV